MIQKKKFELTAHQANPVKFDLAFEAGICIGLFDNGSARRSDAVDEHFTGKTEQEICDAYKKNDGEFTS